MDRTDNVFLVGIIGSSPEPVPGCIMRSNLAGELGTWVDNYQTPASGCLGAFAAAPNSELLYAGGCVAQEWAVYTSTDGGESWNLSDPPFNLGSPGGNCIDLAVDADGVAYAVGFVRNKKGQSAWVVRRKDPDGWHSVDVAGFGNQTTFAAARGVVSSQWGLLVAGDLVSGSSTFLTVRRSTDAGVTWATMPGSMKNANAGEITVDTKGNIYVVGYQNGRGLIRISQNGGQSWPIQHFLDQYTGARGVTTIPRDGNWDDVYVCGFRVESGISYWTVYRLLNGGAPVLSDSFADFSAQAAAICSDASGQVFVTGLNRPTPEATSHWVVRRLSTSILP